MNLSRDSSDTPKAGDLIGRFALDWIIMLGAMMGPMLAMPIRYLVDRSFSWRRGRAVVLFLVGYLAVWMIPGVILFCSTWVLPRDVLRSAAFASGVIAVAAVWQCSPLKQRCLNRGHSHSIPAAFGGAADVDSLLMGLTHGRWCVGSCWALMLIPHASLFPHLLGMGSVTVWLVAERLEIPMSPTWQLRAPRMGGRVAVAAARLIFQHPACEG